MRIYPVVGLGFAGKFHTGADVMTDGPGIERRRQVSLVGQDLVAGTSLVFARRDQVQVPTSLGFG